MREQNPYPRIPLTEIVEYFHNDTNPSVTFG